MIDQETIKYLKLTGRDEHTIALVETYAKHQGLWFDETRTQPVFSHVLKFDLNQVQPSVAGPKRPQDRVILSELATAMASIMPKDSPQNVSVTGESYTLNHGDVVIAAITSCTNTSNPSVLMAAGLLAKKACELGLSTKPWVKTSLAPGSQVVTDYLKKAGLQQYLDQLGFELVGYGCTTCIGNSGPLDPAISTAITQHQLTVSAVLSGNRNFEGRIHPLVKANWLASPPLVVAFALLGHTRSDISAQPLGYHSQTKKPIYLKDIWPSQDEIQAAMNLVTAEMFKARYAQVFDGHAAWQALKVSKGLTFDWQAQSTYIQKPPFFEALPQQVPPTQSIKQAHILAIFGDSITTDHISPAGSIKLNSPAGQYLQARGIKESDFNSYGSRRGNHEIMIRGTFANIRIHNEILPGIEGGLTKYLPNDETMSIYDAAMQYATQQCPLIIIAGKEYGTGSSRDWAAKGTKLLGVKAVIAESFERIHRSNLVGMGVLPLEFMPNENRHHLKLTGYERIDIDCDALLKPQEKVKAHIYYPDGEHRSIVLQCRIDTQNELNYFRNGGILQYVLRQIK